MEYFSPENPPSFREQPMKRTGIVLSALILAVGAATYFYSRPTSTTPSSSEDASTIAMAQPESATPGQVATGDARDGVGGGVASASLPPIEGSESLQGTGPGGNYPTPLRPAPGRLEASLFDGVAVSARASEMLSSKQFGMYFAKLQSESTAESVARLQDYRPMLEKTLAATTEGVSIDRMACGTNLCVAVIQATAGASGFKDWLSTIQGAASKGKEALPMPALTSWQVPLAGGGVENRILFTTNRAHASFSVGPDTTPAPSR